MKTLLNWLMGLFHIESKNRFNSRFGELKVGNAFSFIDETVDPVAVRIGYIQKISEDKSKILIYTPSLNKTVTIYRKDINYFLMEMK